MRLCDDENSIKGKYQYLDIYLEEIMTLFR